MSSAFRAIHGANCFRFEPFPYLSEYVCHIWWRSDGRVGKKGGYRQTQKGMPQLYIVDCIADREQLGQQMLNEQTNESTEYLSARVP